MRLLIVIPARLGSTRLPNKPLRLLGGEPLIRAVARRVLGFGLEARVVVAGDDPLIADAVAPLGVEWVLTEVTHRSGTERVASVAARPEFSHHELIVNVQGDEPFIAREALAGALDQVMEGFDVGTVAHPVGPEALRDPNRVKVEVDGRGRALGFFRVPPVPTCSRREAIFQHVGVYAFRRAALAAWMAAPPIEEEETERLEQLRPLSMGLSIGVALLPQGVPAGIDTEADLLTAEALL